MVLEEDVEVELEVEVMSLVEVELVVLSLVEPVVVEEDVVDEVVTGGGTGIHDIEATLLDIVPTLFEVDISNS